MSEEAIAAFRAGLDPGTLATVDRLRAIAADVHPGLAESIKWNAPSFALAGEDRITLGLDRKGGVRVVLHRGAKVKDAAALDFVDEEKLANWPARDRAVLVFADADEVEAKRDPLKGLFARWIAATTAA